MHFYSGGAFKASSIKESVWIAAGAMRIGRYLVLIILFVGFFIVFGNRGLLDNQRLKEKLAELRAETSRLEAADNGLKREVVLLRDDLRYIESVARNELGMLKRGDLIYRFMDSAGKKDEAAAPPASNEGAQPPKNDDSQPATRPGSSI
jgi:cell division protein FtsB